MKKIFYLILYILSVTYVKAKQRVPIKDSLEPGIRFLSGLTWKQILKKAERENKYIFLDCYATWCEPCRLMDKEVYSKKQVAEFYNRHFISVKCQMDKTDKDAEAVKNWYKDVDRIKDQYGIPVYPTYLYFSPDGNLVSRDEGYKAEDDFIAIAKRLMEPKFQGRYLTYYSMLAKYRKGKKDYKEISALIDTAKYLNQENTASELVKSYREYLERLPAEQLYRKEHISFISSTMQDSKDLFFPLYYPNGEKVDSVMGQNGYAQLIVDKLILKEDIYPYLRSYELLHKDDPPLLIAQSYPDWLKVVKDVTAKYNADYGNRTVLQAQVRWYKQHHDYAQCARYFTVLENNFLMDNYTEDMDVDLNFIVWDAIFKRSVDKEQINAGIECMQGAIGREIARGKYVGEYLDTYARLLYKAGRVKEALENEQKAIDRSIEVKQPEWVIKEFQETLDKMKVGKLTWPGYIGKNE